MPPSAANDSTPGIADRRRSPRFNCAGKAVISHLPFEGIAIAGRLRNLSIGGICLDTLLPVNAGARAEIVVSVNAVSFRAAALVREAHNSLGSRFEFVQLSSRGRELLHGVMDELARMQALNRKLKSGTLEEVEAAIAQRGLPSQLWRTHRLSSAAAAGINESDNAANNAASESLQNLDPEQEPLALIDIDLFG